MKKILLIILILPATVHAVDTELQDLAELVAIAGTDVLYVVDDPAGAPASRKITATNLFDMIDTSAELLAILTNETGTGAAVFANTPTLVTPVIGAATGTSLAATTFLSTGADAADAGAIRLSNAEVIGWEDATEATITHVDNTGWVVNLEWEVDGTLDADGAVTLGDNGDTVVIDSSDWDINATGVASGLGAITSDGAFVTTANAITLGDTAAGDPVITFDSGNDGTITWEEDGQDWEFTGDIEVAGDVLVSGGNINTGDIALTIGDGTTDTITFSTDGTGTAEIAMPAGSVDGTEILDDTIDSGDYAALSIDAEHLAADIIDETKIADNGIDSEHYNDGSIDLAHLAAGVYAKDIVTTAPVTGATDNVLVGADGDVTLALDFTAAWDFGGAASLELPNAAAPTTDATGEIALDTTIADHQPLHQYYDGGENMTIIAIDTAQLPALDNEIIKYDAGSDKFVLEADAGGGGGNDVYVEEGDAAKVDSSGADLYIDFDATDFDVGVVGNEGNVTIPDDGHNHTTTSISGIVAADMGDADHEDVEWSGNLAYVQAATIADTVYASCYVGLFQGAAGNNEPFYTDGALTYDATSGTLAATEFSGGGSGLTLASTDLTDTAAILYETELDDFAELQAQIADDTLVNTADGAIWSGVHNFGGATSFEPPNGADPDVTVTGQISVDTDGANEPNDVVLRTIDGNGTQVALAQEQKSIQATIVKPNDLANATRDKCPIWSNETGMTFVITKIEAWSDTDDTAFVIDEFDGDGASNTAEIEGDMNCTTGTGPYTDTETAIDAATVEANHTIFIDFDDTDDPGWVKVSICGYFLSDVN